MNPQTGHDQSPSGQPGQPRIPGPAGSSPAPGVPARRPATAAHDPRLGFRRQFISDQSFMPGGGGGQAQEAPRTPAEMMGGSLYDDPYFQPQNRYKVKNHRRGIIIFVVLLVVVSIGLAIGFQAIKRHNPNGFFVGSIQT